MKPNKDKILEVLVKYQDKAFNRDELACLSGVPKSRVSDCVYRLVVDGYKDIYPTARGVWTYSPNKVFDRYLPPATRLHTFITEAGNKGVSTQEIADAFNIKEEEVTRLIGRMVGELGQRPNRTVYYSFPED